MTLDEFNPVRERYSQNCFTKSTNPQVLEVYAYILEHENWDSDWWDESGPGKLAFIFDTYSSKQDWIDLEVDLSNWSIHQLEIFTGAIMNGYQSFSYLDQRSWYRTPEGRPAFEKLTKTIPNRFHLLLPLLNIQDEKHFHNRVIEDAVVQNIDFLFDHFDILLDSDASNLAKMYAVAARITTGQPHHMHFSDKITTALVHRQESGMSRSSE